HHLDGEYSELMIRRRVAAFLTTVVATLAIVAGSARSAGGQEPTVPTLDAAQLMFYNGGYAAAAGAARALCTTDPDTLAACELRTSSLLFQLRRAIGDAPDREKAFAACQSCPALLSVFVAETRAAQEVARDRLKTHPGEEETLFFLGKLDLNYVWLQL